MSTPSLWADRPVRGPETPPRTAPAAPQTPAPAAPPTAATATRPRRRPAPRRPRVVDALAVLAGLGLGITLALAISAESAGSLSADGGVLTALGRVTGLVAAYAMVVVVVLVARVPPLERAIGQDRLLAWHRRLGPWPLYLLVAHAVLITLGYAQGAHTGVLHQAWLLLTTYEGILASAVGSALLVAAGVTSYRKARARMAYETWWSVHLYTYLALYLSFSHQIHTGASFVGHATATAWWTALWVGTLALVLGARVGLPLWRTLRHDVRVVGVQPEAPGVVSVLLEGRALDRLPVAGGQFLQWRFLKRGMWWQAHPFSLSAAPAGRHLRITVKDLGDLSGALARLTPGTRVAIEGPYGVFTAEDAGPDVLLVGAGVGIAPIHAVLQELPDGTDVEVVLRAHTGEDLVLRDAVTAEVRRRGGVVHELVGPRERVAVDAEALARLVTRPADRDVYVCGPDGFSAAIRAAALRLGVPAERIHLESFTS